MVDLIKRAGGVSAGSTPVTSFAGSSVSSRELAGPYSALGRAMDAAGDKIVDSYRSEAIQQGKNSVTTDEKGEPVVHAVPEWTQNDRAYNAAARHGALAMRRTQTDQDIQRLRLENEGNPEGFNAALKGYTQGIKADPAIRADVRNYAATTGGSHYNDMLRQKHNVDIKVAADGLTQRVTMLAGQLDQYHMSGDTSSDEYKAALGEWRDAVGALANNPKFGRFGWTPARISSEESAMSQRGAALAVVGAYRREYEASGNAAAVLQRAERDLRGLKLSENTTQQYLSLVRRNVAGQSAIKSVERAQLRELAQSRIDMLAGGDLLDDGDWQSLDGRLRSAGMVREANQLYTQKVITEHRGMLELGTPEERREAMQAITEAARTRGATPSALPGGFNVNAARQAIANIESAGGNYSAIGPVVKKGRYAGDRAVGKYQVMSRNIPSWTREALGRSMTREEFLADPKAQDAVFDHHFGKSVKRYGSVADAASVWFTGGPASKAAGKHDDYTTAPTYIKRFVRDYNSISGSSTPRLVSSAVKSVQSSYNSNAREVFNSIKQAYARGHVPTPEEIEAFTALMPAVSDGKLGAEAQKLFAQKNLEKVFGAQTSAQMRGVVDAWKKAGEAGRLGHVQRETLVGFGKMLAKRQETLAEHPLDAGVAVAGKENFTPAAPLDFANGAKLGAGLKARVQQLAVVRSLEPGAAHMPLYKSDVAGLSEAFAAADGARAQELSNAVGASLNGDQLYALASNDDMKSAIKSMAMASDPMKMMAGMSLMNQIYRDNPLQFDALFGSKAKKQLQYWQTFRNSMPPDKIAEHFLRADDPKYIEARKDREKAASALLDKVTADDVVRKVANPSWFNRSDYSPAEPLGGMDKEGLKKDYDSLFKDQFAANNSAEAAEKAAMDILRKTWGVSSVNGNRVMRFPPELMLGKGAMVNGSFDWIKTQLRGDIEQLVKKNRDWAKTSPNISPSIADTLRGTILGGVFELAADVFGDGERVTKAEAVLGAQPMLFADKKTEAQITAKQKPGWLVVVPDIKGRMTILQKSPNDPFRYYPDRSDPLDKARNAAALERDRKQEVERFNVENPPFMGEPRGF